MGLFKFIFSKTFLVNLGLAVAFGLLILVGVNYALDSYTRHGEDILVPDYSKIHFTKLDSTFEQSPLQYTVIDSVYEPKMPKGVVMDQNPVPGAKVKQGRMVYITINATNPPMIKMPDVVDLSLRQAIAKLEDYGFKLGEKQYIPDLAKDAVLRQEYQGKVIKPGSLLPKNSKIDLILGDGLQDNKVYIPYVINMTYEEAMDAINLSSLSVGAVVFDKTFKDRTDTLKAKVYRQIPTFDPEDMQTVGDPVDIFLTFDTTKIKIDEDIRLKAEELRKSKLIGQGDTLPPTDD